MVQLERYRYSIICILNKAIDIVLHAYSIVSLYKLQKSTPESNLSEATKVTPPKRLKRHRGGFEAAKIGASTLSDQQPPKR